ncbi:MAG TPA: endo-1,4-beta-xylanase [Sphingomonas sp.]|nr:endo-1,4-beta-xylanase [Sphingomonas sp.]
MIVTRRQALAGGGALAFAPRIAAAPSGSLDAIGQARGIRFGTAVGYGQFQDPRYRALIEAECGVIVHENELKMPAIHPAGPDSFNFARPDEVVDYAVAHGIKVRGHNLLWHHPRWLPRWAESHDYGAHPAEGVARILTNHIRTVARHYGNRIYTWDVVNEAVDEKTGRMRDTVFSKAMGSPEAVLDLAFRTARAALPGCELVYNDYMNWDTPEHCGGVLRLLEGFRKRGVPVDTLGLQSHIAVSRVAPHAGFGPDAEKSWRAFLDAVTAMGYKLQITEFDVNDQAAPGDFADRDRMVADVARAYLDCTLSYPQVSVLMVWGMTDRYSWLQGFRRRADGLPQRCCPYDADFKPHPLRDAIARALAGAPKRS